MGARATSSRPAPSARLAMLAMAQPRLRWASDDARVVLLFSAISRNKPEQVAGQGRLDGARPTARPQRGRRGARAPPAGRRRPQPARFVERGRLARRARGRVPRGPRAAARRRGEGRLFSFLRRPLAAAEPSRRRGGAADLLLCGMLPSSGGWWRPAPTNPAPFCLVFREVLLSDWARDSPSIARARPHFSRLHHACLPRQIPSRHAHSSLPRALRAQ